MIKAILNVANKILEHFSPFEKAKRRMNKVSTLKAKLKDVEFDISKYSVFKKDKDSRNYLKLLNTKRMLEGRIKDLAGRG